MVSTPTCEQKGFEVKSWNDPKMRVQFSGCQQGALWPPRHAGRPVEGVFQGSTAADPQAGPGTLNEGETALPATAVAVPVFVTEQGWDGPTLPTAALLTGTEGLPRNLSSSCPVPVSQKESQKRPEIQLFCSDR